MGGLAQGLGIRLFALGEWGGGGLPARWVGVVGLHRCGRTQSS